ncbi:hypothetical protein HYS95_03305 [Candidatus Daviesbacteria bacterium]|nr:hypothetical protein [Candidatus Daviesbacteria bacterium]
MPKLNQKGVIAQAVILILLLLGAVVGVYLVQNRTNLFPKAGGSRPLWSQNSFTLMGPKVCKNGWVCYLAGRPGLKEEFEVKLYAKSDLEEANLFTAKMTFPKDVIEVKDIKTEGSFIKNWVEEYYDNNTGEISLSGGVPSPGYKTQIGQESVLMATITFHAKALGKGEISFTDSSAIYSNLNNINILTMTEGYDVVVEKGPEPVPTVTPKPTCQPRPACIDTNPRCLLPEPIEGWCSTPAPSASPTPKPGTKGDGNKDGKINLIDMSVLHTDWNVDKDIVKQIRAGVDMNDDGLINTVDFAALRQLLQDLKVIKVK